MRRVIDMAARHPVLANLLMIMIMAAGLMCGSRLPKEVFPQFSLDYIIVKVLYPRASPEETEEAICLKIEEAIEGVQGIKKVESIAAENMGTVAIELLAGVRDPSEVKDDIKNRVDQITTFPDDAEEPVIEELLLRHHVINMVLYGTAPESTLREVARRMKDEILAMDGISQAAFMGVREYEIGIEVSESALRQYGLSLREIADVVARNSMNVPGGTVRTSTQQMKVETKGRRYRGLEFEEIVVLSRPDGTKITLDQIAKVVDGFEEDDRYGRFNGLPAVLLNVHKTSDEDAIEISEKVTAYTKKQQELLPDGLHVTTWTDSSPFIEGRIDLLLRNGRIGIVLVFGALWLFLCLRLSFWVALGIPVSFAFAMVALWACEASINMISLFGFIMALGLVVDDAIVIGENVYRHQREGGPLVDAAVAGTAEMALPVLGAVATTIVAFVPLLFVSGIMGKFIAILPVAVIATLVGSTIEGLLILPAHLSHESSSSGEGRWARRAQSARRFLDGVIEGLIDRVYRPLYHVALRYKISTICLAMAALLSCFGLLAGGLVPRIMFPKTDSEILICQLMFPDGTPVAKTDEAITRIEKAALSMNQHFLSQGHRKVVTTVYASVGQLSEQEFQIAAGPHVGEVWLELRPADERDVHSEETLTAWRKLTGPIPETISLSYKAMRGGPGGKPVELRLKGYDLVALREAAAEVRAELARYGGLYDIEDDYRPGKPELTVRLKPAARALGVTLQDLGRQLRAGYYGEEALRLQRGRDEVKVLVRYRQEERQSLADLESIRIRTQSGLEIPFHEVADVEVVRKASVINREQGQRRINVFAEVDDAVTNGEEVIADFRVNALPKLAGKYPAVTFSFEGQKQESRDSVSTLAIGFLFALFAIYGILAVIFGSYLQPFIIMLTIPFGLIGAVLGHWLLGHPLTMMSLFGMVALAGVVVNDSLVLIHRVNRGIKSGLPVQDAVEQAGPLRFRAIILTTVTTAAGLLPIISEKSLQAQYVIPMAVSLAFGLMFATFVTLFVVPCLFLELNLVRRVLRWLRRGYWPTAEEVEPHGGGRKA